MITRQAVYNERELKANKVNEHSLSLEFTQLRGRDSRHEKTWITRGHLMNITYAKKLMKLLSIETELRDLFEALKNVMLCISYLKLATLRVKAMKAIKKLIKQNPEIIAEA